MPTDAFDAIASGKVMVPWFNPYASSSVGGALTNDAGANAMMGQSQEVIGAQGNIFTQASAGTNPAGSGAEYVVGVTTISGSAFDQAGRGINIFAMGSITTGGQNRVQIVFNPQAAVTGSLITRGTTAVTIADTGMIGGTIGAFSLAASVYKYGVSGSNTQIGIHQQAQIGATAFPLVSPNLMTAVEAGPILVAVTVIASVAANTTINFIQVEASN